jgi:hypothetical protein
MPVRSNTQYSIFAIANSPPPRHCNCEKFTVSTLTIYHVSVFVHSSLATGLCHGTVCFAKYHCTGRRVEIVTREGPQQKSTPQQQRWGAFLLKCSISTGGSLCKYYSSKHLCLYAHQKDSGTCNNQQITLPVDSHVLACSLATAHYR